MKKKFAAILSCVCLIAASVAVFTACGETELVKTQYAYYSFDLYGDGLVLDVSNMSRLPSGALTLPASSYYYPDVPGGEVKEHDLPKTVVKIADGAFAGCDLITSVTIGSTYTELGDGCFENCTGLVTVAFPYAEKVSDAQEIALPANAFKGCDSLKTVTGNPVVTAVGNSAFERCLSLSSLSFQWKNGFTVGDMAFYYDISLPGFDLTNAGSVGARAFGGWDEARITLPADRSVLSADWNKAVPSSDATA